MRSGDDLDDLRLRLERLEGLPLRPSTARGMLAAVEAGLGADAGRAGEVDPGVALGRLRGASGLSLVAERPWWSKSAGVERLWRHGVAVGLSARRLAAEAGRPEADRWLRVGLVHQVGPWALAAVDPALLDDWLDLETAARRDRERAWFGREIEGFGRELAERWGADPLLADAAWLHADGGNGLKSCASDPPALALVQKAYELAERTPWALRRRDETITDARVRHLTAEVQVRCGESFVADDASPREEALSRSHARLRLRAERLERELDYRDSMLRAISGPDPSNDAARGAWSAWTGLINDRDRLGRRLESAASAHRRRVEAQERSLFRAKLDALAEFAAGAGHELNNPLAVIQGRAQLLLARPADPDAAQSLRTIIAQARRAHRILRDLMYAARPPAPRPRPCQPNELLNGVIRELGEEAESRGVGLRVELPEPQRPWDWADPDLLRHLADVLVRNAIEATPPGGLVRVVADAQPGRLRWTVHDGGRGLDPREARFLFDPFFCGRSAGRGLGLGLTRAGRSLTSAGGSIDWRSSAGRGTVFRASLPLPAPPGDGDDHPVPAVSNPS